MKIVSLSTSYLLGRFIFGLTLLFPFHLTGMLEAKPTLLYILFAFIVASGVRLPAAYKQIAIPDFLVDITFIAAMIFLHERTAAYLSLLFLLPIFFAALLIETKRFFLLPASAIVLYAAAWREHQGVFTGEGLLNIALHAVSFFLIAFAGNSVKERLQAQERHIARLEEERVRMLGFERLYRVSADLAHELRNPLASISASVQFLREGSRDEELLDMLDMETGRLTRLVNDFLLFARPAEAPREPVNLKEALEMLIAHAGTEKAIELSPVADVTVQANRTFFDAALQNILRNALEAARSRVKVGLSGVREAAPSGAFSARIDIEDDGPGIDPALGDRIFEPFVTTKAEGTGLGLAVANRIVTGFGGIIVTETSVLGGAKFSIFLPKDMKGGTYARLDS